MNKELCIKVGKLNNSIIQNNRYSRMLNSAQVFSWFFQSYNFLSLNINFVILLLHILLVQELFRYRGVLLLIPVPWTPSNRIINACVYNVITRLLYMSMLLHVTYAVTLAWTYLSRALKHHRHHRHCPWFACSTVTVFQLRTYYYRYYFHVQLTSRYVHYIGGEKRIL